MYDLASIRVVASLSAGGIFRGMEVRRRKTLFLLTLLNPLVSGTLIAPCFCADVIRQETDLSSNAGLSLHSSFCSAVLFQRFRSGLPEASPVSFLGEIGNVFMCYTSSGTYGIRGYHLRHGSTRCRCCCFLLFFVSVFSCLLLLLLLVVVAAVIYCRCCCCKHMTNVAINRQKQMIRIKRN